jgi:hypothetical protein
MARVLLVAVLVVVSGCGGTPATPSAVSSPNASATATVGPPIWTGPRTLTDVSGGECVGPVFAAKVGSASAYDLRLTQNGSSLTAVATDRKTGLTVNYTGTIEGTSMSLAQSPGFSWSPGTFQYEDFACGDGQVRDLLLGGSTITATLSGNTVTGTVVEPFDVYVAEMVGPARRYISDVGELVLTSSFVLTR